MYGNELGNVIFVVIKTNKNFFHSFPSLSHEIHLSNAMEMLFSTLQTIFSDEISHSELNKFIFLERRRKFYFPWAMLLEIPTVIFIISGKRNASGTRSGETNRLRKTRKTDLWIFSILPCGWVDVRIGKVCRVL